MLEALDVAEEAGCDLAAFPGALAHRLPAGGPLAKPAFVCGEPGGLERVAAATAGCAAVVGFVDIVGAAATRAPGERAR